MTVKPSYEELENRVKILEQEASQRERSEKNLKIQKTYLQGLFDCAPEAIVLANRKKPNHTGKRPVHQHVWLHP